ncbi:MAG: Cna B-type domain-containing protein, partial [Coriobacteriales bacterium]
MSSITISLADDAADVYQINGISSSSQDGTVSVFDNYTASVSSDGKTLTLTPNDASASIDLSDLTEDRLLGAVDLGFRLVDNGTYDRDSWYDALTNGDINSGDLLNVTVNYQNFTSSGSDTSSTTATSTMTLANYEVTDPGVRQTSADTSTYMLNNSKYGDDPIEVAAVVESAGAADQTVWIGESIDNLVTYSSTDDKVTIHDDASGYALVTEYPYEVRGTEYQIRPKYTATASTLDDQFSPGGFELDKVVFTLSDGSTVEVSADNATFASDWNAALSSNGTFTVTADQLGVASSFTSDNESSVLYVTKVTQVYKTASPSIISDTSNYWSFRMTKWSVTTYEEDGTTVLGTGSLTHSDGTVEENGSRWYPITSTLYTDESLGTEVASSEHNIQVREEQCPEFEMVTTSGGQWAYNQWKYESENETGSYLGIRIQSGTDLSTVNTTLTNPTIDIYHYWMDNYYTWTGEMDVTPAMAGWTVTYGVTTYAKQQAGEAVEVRTMQLPSAEDFQDSSKTNEDGTITIDLLPNTDGDETGSDWEYFAASSSVDVGTDGFGRAEPVAISFHYDGDWDVTSVADSDGDGIIDNNGTDGFLVKNIVASSRTFDVDGQYAYYLWWDGGHITKMCYQWDNCVDNDAAHLSTATSTSGTGNWGHVLAATVEQLGAQIIEPTKLTADWTGTLSQGATSTISGSLTLTANPIGSPEWQPSGDVLYIEFPDEDILFAGNASIDGVSDPDAYVTTINGTRYLVIHDNASTDTVKSPTTDTSTDWQHPTSNVTYEPLEVSFDVYTLPTASTTSAATVIGSNTYLDFSDHQYYANVSNNPSDGTFHTAIQKKGTLNWNGARDGLGNGACVDNPLGVHTKSDITDHYWAIKTTGISLTPALNTNLGLLSYSGTNASTDDSADSLVVATGLQSITPDQQSQMESLVVLSAGENGLTNGEIVIEVPTDGTTVSDSTTSYDNSTTLTLRGAVKQYGTLADGEELTFQVSTDGTNYVDVTDDTDWSTVRYIKASINQLSANESVMFTLPFSASSDTVAGDYAYLQASATYTVPEGSRSAQSVSGYVFKETSSDPDPVTYAITGTKTLTQDGEAISMTDGQFKVNVTADDGNDTSGYTGFTAGNYDVSSSGEFTTGNITFTQAGTYTFNVSEVDGGNALYTYDDTDYTVTVTVTANSDNALEATAEISNGTETVDSITFANTKQSEQQITVTKEWVGFAASSATVHLLADGVEVDSATLTATDGWTHTFSVDSETSNGTDITYTVTEDSIDNYTSEITGSETAGFTVTNTYGGLTVDDPPVSKTITGDEPDSDSTFTFTFTALPDSSTLPDDVASDAMPMPGGASDQSVTTTITGEGTS